MKTSNIIMTHEQIYQKGIEFLENFSNIECYLPAAVVYSIEKNKQKIIEMANDIEQSRLSILNHYGFTNENNQIEIPSESIEKANEELKNLLSIENDIKIYTFKIEELNNINFTPNQMKTILFMIDEE